MRKILLNYDYKLFPFTTASYYEMSLKDHPDFEPFRLGEIEPTDADFILNFEPCDACVTAQGVPSAYYEIDNHLIRGGEPEKYNPVDFVFVAQYPFLDFYPVGKTSVIPLACYPPVHRPFDLEDEIYDVGFIGNDTYEERKGLLDLIGKKYKLLRTTSDPGKPYSRLLSQCCLTFNKSMLEDINMRFFEAIAVGRPLLTDYLPDQDRFAKIGVHYFIYRDWKDLDNKIKHLRASPGQRQEVGTAGSEHVRKHHTYIKRFLQMLDVVEKGREK